MKYISVFLIILLCSCGQKQENKANADLPTSATTKQVLESVEDEDGGKDLSIVYYSSDEYLEKEEVKDSHAVFKSNDGDEGVYPKLWSESDAPVLGIGAVNIQSNYPYHYEDSKDFVGEYRYYKTLSLYNNEECTDLYVKYQYITGMTPKSKNITLHYNASDYGYYCFIVTAVNPTSYEVAINESDRRYIKKHENIEFSDWEKFYEDIFYINSEDDNPFRVSPSEDAEKAKLVFNPDEEDEFIDSHRKVKIEGEWMRLTFTKLPKQDGELQTAWIRWRIMNKIILDTAISV